MLSDKVKKEIFFTLSKKENVKQKRMLMEKKKLSMIMEKMSTLESWLF